MDGFTLRSFYTQMPVRQVKTFNYTEGLLHRSFYTKKSMHTGAFAHKDFYTKESSPTEVFAPRSSYRQLLCVQTSLCKNFRMQKLVCVKASVCKIMSQFQILIINHQLATTAYIIHHFSFIGSLLTQFSFSFASSLVLLLLLFFRATWSSFRSFGKALHSAINVFWKFPENSANYNKWEHILFKFSDSATQLTQGHIRPQLFWEMS